MPTADPGRAGLLDSIQKAGGVGALKKVDRNEIRDRSGAAAGSGDTGPHGSGLPPSGVGHGGGQGTMADALAVALQKRKEKVSKSGRFSLFFYLPMVHYFAWVVWVLTGFR